MDLYDKYVKVQECVSDIKVSDIADCIDITDVFRYALWSAEEGLNYLAGVFRFDEYKNEPDIMITLDGKWYSSDNNGDAINLIVGRIDRLWRFWDHSRKSDMYSPAFFIKWGLRHKDIFNIDWLDDAAAKNLVGKKLLSYSAKADQDGKELKEREKTSLLKIIAGMSGGAYKYPEHGAKKKIERDMEKIGVHVAENTLSKYLDAARELLPSNNSK